MKKNFQKFGQKLKELRIKKDLTLREFCKKINYDSSNYSKIERGLLSPPSNKKILIKWAKFLGISSKRKKELQEFIDNAQIAQGIIPQDILSQKNAVDYLPAFFRTFRNTKPTKKEIDKLIELIRKA